MEVILLHPQQAREDRVVVDQEKEYKLVVQQHNLVKVETQEHMDLVVLVEQA